MATFAWIPEAALLQRWLSLPVYLAGYKAPVAPQDASAAWIDEEDCGEPHRFFYESGYDADTLLRLGRAMNVALAVALGLIIFTWSRSLFGQWGGMVSLVLYVFSPTALANGSLVTMDMGAATLMTASVWALWRLMQRVTAARLLTSSIVMGCLFLTKLSAVFIVPAGLLMLLVRLAWGPPLEVRLPGVASQVSRRFQQLRVFLLLIAVHVFVAWAIIWAGFDFRFSMAPAGLEAAHDGHQFIHESLDAAEAGWKGELIRNVSDLRLLPQGYVAAAAHTLSFAQGGEFLIGVENESGSPFFFPYCLLIKTPLPVFFVLIMAVWAVVVGDLAGHEPDDLSSTARTSRWQQYARWLYLSSPLWIWLFVFWTAAIRSQFNIGHRHIFPTYPAMFILAGAAGMCLPALRNPRAPRLRGLRAGATVLALVCLSLESLLVWPNYLAYFNQLIGGPSQGYKHLIDSSLDWGQDLPALRDWLAEQSYEGDKRQRVYLSYFGTARPDYYGVHAVPLGNSAPGSQFMRLPDDSQWTGGIYCISATMLQTNGVSSGYGRWNADDEKSYREALDIFQSAEQQKAEGESDEARCLRFGREAWRRYQRETSASGLPLTSQPNDEQLVRYGASFLDLFDRARHGRLMAYLRERGPDANVNYSILVFRLSDEEVEEALFGPPPESGHSDPGEHPAGT